MAVTGNRFGSSEEKPTGFGGLGRGRYRMTPELLAWENRLLKLAKGVPRRKGVGAGDGRKE